MSAYQFVRVRPMYSPKSGNAVANQFIITTRQGRYFQSYSTIIAFIDRDGGVTLDIESWNYSRTTAKYRTQFLGEYTADTRRKIESGEYKLADLNSSYI